MASCVVWVDSAHAKIFKLSVEGVKKKIIARDVPNTDEDFFHLVTNEIGEPPERLLIMGAGSIKVQLKNHLKKFHQDNLIDSLVGVEPMPDVTDLEILEASRKYFKKTAGQYLSM